MSAPDVLIALVEAGVVLSADGDRLRYRAPEGALEEELRGRVAGCRPALLALVRAGAVLPAELAAWSADAREAFEERAGIMQFDGGLPRLIAEREAERCVRVEHVRAWLCRAALVAVPPASIAVAGPRTGGGPHR